MPVCFIWFFFCTVYCNENRLKNNMTPYEPRHKKTCLGTDHLIFCGGGVGWGWGKRKTEIFFSHSPCISWSQSIYMGILFICSCIHVSWIFGSECIWTATWQNRQNGCAPSEDSDQPGQPPSLIRVFAARKKKHWVLSYALSAQWRLWSDWADAQADLSLRWEHSFCWFCHVVAHMYILKTSLISAT